MPLTAARCLRVNRALMIPRIDLALLPRLAIYEQIEPAPLGPLFDCDRCRINEPDADGLYCAECRRALIVEASEIQLPIDFTPDKSAARRRMLARRRAEDRAARSERARCRGCGCARAMRQGRRMPPLCPKCAGKK
jgi:hypothetical protein